MGVNGVTVCGGVGRGLNVFGTIRYFGCGVSTRGLRVTSGMVRGLSVASGHTHRVRSWGTPPARNGAHTGIDVLVSTPSPDALVFQRLDGRERRFRQQRLRQGHQRQQLKRAASSPCTDEVFVRAWTVMSDQAIGRVWKPVS